MSVREEIMGVGAQLARAINAGDAATAAGFYTEDGSVMAPGAARVDGRSSVQAYWQAAIDAGLSNVVLTTLEVEEFGGSATEVGILTGSLGATELTGKYIVLWSQTNAGWKLHRDIWNFDA